ncbi:hypothetical protein [Paracoccus sp. (in: a-proteobacteria)]|uniref:hypothetical protein n=1 Tax=Paracoccus sp. TaxID=267 RepID=UPI00405A2C72
MNFTSAMLGALNSQNMKVVWLIWTTVKDRSNGNLYPSGIHSDLGELTLSVEGQGRTYIGGGELLEFPDLTFETGLNVQTQRLNLNILDPSMISQLRVYDPTLAPTEIHLAMFDPETNDLIGISRAFKGWIDKVKINETDVDANAELELVSDTRAGTKGLTLKKSDASQKLINPNDEGRKYADVSGKTKIAWGQKGGDIPDYEIGRRSTGLSRVAAFAYTRR